MFFKKYNLKNFNYILAILCIGLMAFGMQVIYRVDKSLVVKQGIGAILAIVVMLILAFTDYHLLIRMRGLLYGIGLAFLLAVLLFGITVNNAKRWFNFGGITFQPSELIKIIMIIFMAGYLSQLMSDGKVNTLRGIMKFLIFLAIPMAFIIKQPDLSTTLCISMVLVIMLYLAGLSYRVIGITLLITIPLASVFIWYIQQPDQKLLYAHQVARIMSFIYPAKYADESLQQTNSVMAIGSGQLKGKLAMGETNSVMESKLIPEQQTDFIFSAIGESYGFIGCVILIVILLIIVLQCIRIGRKAKDDAGKLIAWGVGTLIAFQSFINIGVATRLLPNTGLPLPFISYGLTSLVCLAMGIGLVLNVGLQKRKY